MAKRPKRKSESVYTEKFFAKIERHNVHLRASLNHDAYVPQNAIRDIDEDPFYVFSETLELSATILSPKKMAEGALAITIYGVDKPPSLFSFVIQSLREQLVFLCNNSGNKCINLKNKL